MKIKSKSKFIIFFKIIKFFQKKYLRLFNSFYKQKLNSIILELTKNNIKIDNVYDIGAYKGEWTNLISKTCLKESKFFLFEANKENEVFLNKTNYKYFINVLSDTQKTVDFFSKTHTGDSYYREETDFYNPTAPKQVSTTTLNLIQEKNNIPFPDFIKIDTQGSEIDILMGADEVLKNCKIILLECPIISYNKGAPAFDEYIKYLNKINYLPLDITELHYIDKVLIQVDIIFLKKEIFHKIFLNKKILKSLQF